MLNLEDLIVFKSMKLDSFSFLKIIFKIKKSLKKKCRKLLLYKIITYLKLKQTFSLLIIRSDE